MDSLFSHSYQSLLNHELLTSREEVTLGRKAFSGCVKSRERLVACNARLVYSEAIRFSRNPSQVSEYFSAGLVGLMSAAGSYNPDRKEGATTRFGTYAIFRIKREMQDLSRKIMNGVATLSPGAVKLLRSVNALRREFPDIEESDIAEKLGVPLKKVISVLSVCQSRSLDAPLTSVEGSSDFYQVLPADELDPVSQVEQEDANEMLMSAVKCLSPFEQEILKLRFGLDNTPIETLEVIGKRYKRTRERIRQIEAHALKTLRVMASRRTKAFAELAA